VMVHPTVKNSRIQNPVFTDRDKYRDRFFADKHQFAAEPLSYQTVPGQQVAAGPGPQVAGMIFKEDEEEFDGHQDCQHWDEFSSANSQSEFGDERSRHSSSSVNSASEANRISKDEKLAREAGITFPIKQIVGLPMDEFNDLLSRQDLTEEQTNICRDIRRRGKNKVAAQNCRKRKLDQVAQLEVDLRIAKQKGVDLQRTKQIVYGARDKDAQDLNQMINNFLKANNKNPTTHTVLQDYQIVQLARPGGPEPQGSLRPKAMSEPQREERLGWNALGLHHYQQYQQYCSY